MIRPKSVPNHPWWDWCKSQVPHPPHSHFVRSGNSSPTTEWRLHCERKVFCPKNISQWPSQSSNPDLALISFQVSKTWLWQNNQRKAPLQPKRSQDKESRPNVLQIVFIVNTRGIILSRSQILTAWEKTMSCLLRISYSREACLASSCNHMIWNVKRRNLSVFWLPKVHLREFGFVSK